MDDLNDEVEPEGITWRTFFWFLILGFRIHTENGKKDTVKHLQKCHQQWVYVCHGCGRVCCACFGGAPDTRCDTCVAEDEERGITRDEEATKQWT